MAKRDFCVDAPFRRSLGRGSLALGVVSLAYLLAAPARAEVPAAGGATAATAQPSPEEMAAAKQHFDSGAKFFQDGNYSAARAEFQAAYDLSKLTPLLFNLGRTAEKQGQKEEALRYYDQYLASNPSDAEEVRKHLVELRGESGAAAPSAQALDGGPAWLKGTSKLPPIPAMAALGAGVVFLAIGIGTGAAALSTQKEVASASNRYWTGDVAALYDKGKALNGAAIAFDVLGGVALAGGAAWMGYWIYLRGKQPSAATTPAVAPTARIVPSGNGLAVVGSF